MSKFLIVSGYDILARTEDYPTQNMIDNIRDEVFGLNSNIGLDILRVNSDHSTTKVESFC